MAVTTRRGKQTIDPPAPSGVEDEMRGDDVVEKVSGELVDKTGKEVELPQKVTPIPRPPPSQTTISILAKIGEKDRGW